MNRLASALVFAAALAAPAGAQDSPAQGTEQSSPAADAAPAEEPQEQGPIEASNAKENYPAIVEAYVNQHAVNGAMPFKDKTKRVWKLELQTIDMTTFKRLRDNVYTACARMRDGDNKLDLDFTVDFSGDHWHVSSVNLHMVNGKARFEYRGGRRIAVPGAGTAVP